MAGFLALKFKLRILKAFGTELCIPIVIGISMKHVSPSFAKLWLLVVFISVQTVRPILVLVL